MGSARSALSARPPRAVVRAAVRAALADLEPGERVVVALSGGPDSLALLAATVRVAADCGLLCAAVVVDHGLQDASSEVAANAEAQARLVGCEDTRVIRVQVRDEPGSGGPEAAARAARYAALDAAAHDPAGQPPAAAILLGHTRDDQSETVLLGLARGSGTRSLAGMRAQHGRYRRPLLDVQRAIVQAAARADALEDPRLTPWMDPHNENPRFTRARVRKTVVPLLEEELGPGVSESLARTAVLARDDADALDLWADHVWTALHAAGAIELGAESRSALTGRRDEPPMLAACGAGALGGELPAGTQVLVGVRAASLDESPVAGAAPALGTAGPVGSLPRTVPAAIRSRIVRRLLLMAGCPASALTVEHVRSVVALVDGSAGDRTEVALPGGRRVRREGAYVRVRA